MIFEITQQFFTLVESFKEDSSKIINQQAIRSSNDRQTSFSKSTNYSDYQQQLYDQINEGSIQSQLYHKYANDIFNSLNKIVSIMIQSKQNYFSNAAYSYAAFTDQQRSQFDLQIRASLEAANRKIDQLNDIVNKGHHYNLTQKQHMKSLVICLYQFFKAASSQFKQFIQFNQLKKQKILNTIAMQSKKQRKPITFQRKISSIDQNLQEQSKMIYMQKVSEQKQIEDTRKTLENISQTLNQMSNKVLQQQLITSSFMQIGQTGLFHINKGNQNLVQSIALSKESGKYWTYYFLFLAISLLIFDFIKS